MIAQKIKDDLTQEEQQRFIATIWALAKILKTTQTIFNPSSEVVNYVSEAVNILTGQHSLQSLMDRAVDFVDDSCSNHPAIVISDSITMSTMMIQAAMSIHATHFEGSNEPEAIAFSIFQAFVSEGKLDHWHNVFNQDIQEKMGNLDDSEEQDALSAMTELGNGLMWGLKQLASGKSPINCYVTPEEHELWVELDTWLKSHEDTDLQYEAKRRAFVKIDDDIRAKKVQAGETFIEWALSNFSRMIPEFKTFKQPEDIYALIDKKHKREEREEFKEYLSSFNFNTPQFLRRFNEAIDAKQYNEIYYQILCESETQNESIHQVVKRMWQISQLDTVHVKPQDAKSRMPQKAGNGLNTFNFEYAMEKSEAYTDWLNHPLARACGDIIVDAFHMVTDFGMHVSPDIFMEYLKDYVEEDYDSPRSKKIFELSEKTNRTSEEEQFYKLDTNEDNAIFALVTFLLEQVFHLSPKSIKEIEISYAEYLTKANISLREFYKEARILLEKFMLLSQKMPQSSNDESPFVFGIGFNGSKFDSLGHYGPKQDKNEIWVNFSESKRGKDDSLEGDLFLTLVASFAKHHANKLTVNANLNDSKNYFKQYKTLMKCHLGSSIKANYQGMNRHASPNLLLHRKLKREKYEGFLSQLEQEIDFEFLCPELKKWIENPNNWYYIPHEVSINLVKELSKQENYVQDLTRKLLLDVFCERQFSQEHPELMDLLFLHWKETLLEHFKDDAHFISALHSAKNLDDMSERKANVLDVLDALVYQTEPEIKKFWQEWVDREDGGINKKFAQFKVEQESKKNQRLGEKTEERKNLQKAIKKFQKNREMILNKDSKNKQEALDKIDREINKIQKKINGIEFNISELSAHTLLNSPKDLLPEKYNEFKTFFFKNRGVSQCVEPGLAKVLGHVHFYPVFVSKNPGNTVILNERNTQLSLGRNKPQTVIPPCNARCQHHVMGHLYIGDLSAYNSADRLDKIRQIHSMGRFPRKLLSQEEINQRKISIVNKSTHFQRSPSMLCQECHVEDISTHKPQNNRSPSR